MHIVSSSAFEKFNWSTTVRNKCLLSSACGSVSARVCSYSISKERVKVLLLNRMCGRGEEKESAKEKEREGRKRREAWQFSEVKWGRQLYPGVVVVVGRGVSHKRCLLHAVCLTIGNPSPVLSTFLQNSSFYHSLYALCSPPWVFNLHPPPLTFTSYVFPSIYSFRVRDSNCG